MTAASLIFDDDRGIRNVIHYLFIKALYRFAVFVGLAASTVTLAFGQSAPASESAKMLSCDYGLAGGGMPISPPPGYDAEFAVAVVEIHTATEIQDARVTNFMLTDRAGKIGRMKHVVAVSVFDDPPYPANGIKGTGSLAYYDDLGRSHPWNGTLPQGMIRLRIRVALLDDPFDTLDDPQKCDITVGPYTIEGPVTGSWPVGLVYRVAPPAGTNAAPARQGWWIPIRVGASALR